MSVKYKKYCLWITSWYPNKFHPSNGDFVQRMAAAVAPYYNLVVLNACESTDGTYEIEIRYGEIVEVIIYYPKIDNNKLLLSPVRRLGKLIKALWVGINHIESIFGEPELIHLHVIFPVGYFVWGYLRFKKIPLIITEHWTGFSGLKRSSLRFYHKLPGYLCTSISKKILPVSESIMNDMVRLNFRGSYEVIPNVVDHNIFKAKGKLKLKSNPFTFLHVSSLNDDIKNVSGIIKAFKKFHEFITDSRLLIIGDGKDMQELQKLTNILGINGNVRFIGHIPHECVAFEMEKADVFVLFSFVETFSCVLLEALSVGMPVITSNCGGISSWISEKEGILVEPGDVEGLRASMEFMFGNYQSFMPGIRREIVYSCGKDKIGMKLKNIYLSILENSVA